MAKQLIPIEECLAGELYNLFLDFVDSKQAIPIQSAFYRWLIRRNFYNAAALSPDRFRWHFERLLREGYLRIEPETRALIPLERRIVPRETPR